MMIRDSRMDTAMWSPARWLAVGILAVSLTACGGGAGDASGDSARGGDPTPPPGGTPAPTLSLSANPVSVASGQASTLSWSSTNATSCTASGVWSGAKATSGNQSTGALSASSSFSLTCTGAGGSVTQTVTVAVSATPPPTPAPTVTLSATPTTVTSGGSSTLNWSSTNATGCTASGGWSGSKNTSGSQSTGALSASSTYTLNCTGTGGSAQASVTVTVTAPSPTLTFTANPTSVSSGNASTLTWSTTNATACTASGAWSGSKAASGSQSTGALSTSSTYTLNCTGTGGSVQKSVTVSVNTPPPPPPSGSTVGGYPMPSLQDERNTYTSWAWTWTASKEPGAVTEPISNYTITAASEDVQYGGEGDDLWTYLMMYRRTGNTVYLNRANAWLRYFKQDYVQDVQNDGAVGAHMYGWGLLTWYEHTCELGTCDTEAVPVAEQLGALVENYWAGASPGGAMANWGARRGGRHLLLASRLAQVTGKQRWKDLRDKLINLWLQSSDWYSCGSNCGFYEIGRDTTDEYAGSGAYAAGYRIHSAFQIGILTEAFDHAYRTTGNTALRDRIVAMANFVDQYGLDPTYQYTGSSFGFNPSGNVWHNYFAGCGTSCTFVDPAYTTSLVNTLVRGYKFTGDRRYLDRAKVFFNRGTKTSYGNLTPEVPSNVVHHFVDTKWSADEWYLAYNKGELQYTYLIFENGGDPSVP
jgi:hypothetical protein